MMLIFRAKHMIICLPDVGDELLINSAAIETNKGWLFTIRVVLMRPSAIPDYNILQYKKSCTRNTASASTNDTGRHTNIQMSKHEEATREQLKLKGSEYMTLRAMELGRWDSKVILCSQLSTSEWKEPGNTQPDSKCSILWYGLESVCVETRMTRCHTLVDSHAFWRSLIHVGQSLIEEVHHRAYRK